MKCCKSCETLQSNVKLTIRYEKVRTEYVSHIYSYINTIPSWNPFAMDGIYLLLQLVALNRKKVAQAVLKRIDFKLQLLTDTIRVLASCYQPTHAPCTSPAFN